MDTSDQSDSRPKRRMQIDNIIAMTADAFEEDLQTGRARP